MFNFSQHPVQYMCDNTRKVKIKYRFRLKFPSWHRTIRHSIISLFSIFLHNLPLCTSVSKLFVRDQFPIFLTSRTRKHLNLSHKINPRSSQLNSRTYIFCGRLRGYENFLHSIYSVQFMLSKSCLSLFFWWK